MSRRIASPRGGGIRPSRPLWRTPAPPRSTTSDGSWMRRPARRRSIVNGASSAGIRPVAISSPSSAPAPGAPMNPYTHPQSR